MPANVSIPTNTIGATVAWLDTFSAGITADPLLYGFTAGDAATLASAVSDLDDAYALAGVSSRLAIDPANYTQPNRGLMYAARDVALGIARQMAVLIQADNGISDANKLAIGVVPRNFGRTPIPVPGTAPIIAIQFGTPGAHTLNFADVATPAAKKKPFGAIGVQLFSKVDVAAVEDPGLLLYYGTFTKNPLVVAFDGADAGKIASYGARWLGRRPAPGSTQSPEGPMSAVISANVMF